MSGTSRARRADAARTARRVAENVAREEVESGDADGSWPARTMRALADEGLLGLLVPEDAGGLGGGFTDLVRACEELGAEYPSAGLAFGMHCVGTACLKARATDAQRKKYLEPIARGEHVTTLAVSEAGTGVHFYIPRLSIRKDGDGFVLNGEKAFVTNAGHADSFVVSTASLEGAEDPGRFNLVVVDADTEGVTFGPKWDGLGMRGNDARMLRFEDARVPRDALLGEEGGETWYVFEVIAPFFLTAMAGTYLGVTTRAVREARDALAARAYKDLGSSLSDDAVVQDRFARVWMRATSERTLLYDAARLADAGSPEAALALMSAKASLDEAVAQVTQDALALAGGRAYGKNGMLAMLHRDALASQIMSPTAPLLRTWIARSLLDLPLLAEA